jgi:hypothetical protein
MRTSTKQLWFVIINAAIDTHALIFCLYFAIQTKNVAVWVSAAAIISALWWFAAQMYNSNNARKIAENTAGGKNES